MKHDYTPYAILSYIYKEFDLFSRLEFEFELEEDSRLVESYEELMEGYQTLPKVMFSPKKTTIDNILLYSSTADTND
ncbi:MAG: hypothetical protein WAT79_06185 [Saprospiraceae bacterium]